MSNRRTVLRRLATLPIVGPLLATRPAEAAAPVRDWYTELGVKRIINGAGAYTAMTGSLMRPEVVQAYQYASNRFVRLNDVHDAVGKRIAELMGCEAAMVPSGAAAGLTLGTAACMTGMNQDFILRIPDTTGMKNEVIVQKTHRFPYDHMVRNCGIKLIEIDTAEELEKKISSRTAMLLFLNKADHLGRIRMKEFVELGKKHRVPTFNDAAADTPPLENVFTPLKLGFDLVTISGGKGIRGPQSAGLLLGRKDLIAAARLNTAPNSDSIGRSCKVNKEEMIGMLAALEVYLKHDHQSDWREWERRVKVIGDALTGLPTVTSERTVPKIANQVPHIRIRWDEAKLGLTKQDMLAKLRDGDPEIEVVPEPEPGIEIASWMLQDGEAEIVARRVRAILTGKGTR